MGYKSFGIETPESCDVMPGRLHVLSRIDPLRYEVGALRGPLIGIPFNPVDLVVLVVAAVVGIVAASTLLRRPVVGQRGSVADALPAGKSTRFDSQS